MRYRSGRAAFGLFLSCLTFACGAGSSQGGDAERGGGDAPALDGGDDAGNDEPVQPALCMRPAEDAIHDLFCAASPPSIAGLHELQMHLELAVAPDDQTYTSVATFSSRPILAAIGHSTALSGFRVSPINPRVFLLGEATTMAFQRGVQRVELISRGRDDSRLNFYLVEFEQACNRSDSGCAPGDLYTDAIESEWQRVRVRDEEELKNTPQDCRQCHQRARETPTLLMRELLFPWTHFFFISGDSPLPYADGGKMILDYADAKGDELYGGVLVTKLVAASPLAMQVKVGQQQPLLFNTPAIQMERWPEIDDGYADMPMPSPTWDAGYEAFKRGEQLALPYIEARATDPAKQAALSEAYRQYRAGDLPAAELPDLSEIFPDDPQVRAKIGLQTEPDAAPTEALIQACGSCHNDVLDQSISRARFNIDLSRLDRAQIDRAIERIELPPDAAGAMPPPEARQLEPGTRARLLEYLKRDLGPDDFDPRLREAARLGMAGK